VLALAGKPLPTLGDWQGVAVIAVVFLLGGYAWMSDETYQNLIGGHFPTLWYRVAALLLVVIVLLFVAAYRLQAQLDALRQTGTPHLTAIHTQVEQIVLTRRNHITSSGMPTPTDQGSEHATIAQLMVKNDPKISKGAYARNVGAEVTFFSAGVPVVNVYSARWADKDSPSFPADKSEVGQIYFDVGTTHPLDIAIRGLGGVAQCFAFDNRSLQDGWQNERKRLAEGVYQVRIRLRSSDGIDQAFHCRLINCPDAFDLQLLADAASPDGAP